MQTFDGCRSPRPSSNSVMFAIRLLFCGIWLCLLAGDSIGQTVYNNFGSNGSFSANGWCVTGASTLNCGPAVTRYIAAPFTPTVTVNLSSIALALTYSSGTNGAVINLHNSING